MLLYHEHVVLLCLPEVEEDLFGVVGGLDEAEAVLERGDEAVHERARGAVGRGPRVRARARRRPRVRARARRRGRGRVRRQAHVLRHQLLAALHLRTHNNVTSALAYKHSKSDDGMHWSGT